MPTPITDPVLIVATLSWLAIYTQYDDPLADGYDPRSDTPDLLFVVLISIPEAIILSWPIRAATPIGKVVPLLGVTWFTLVFGVVLLARWYTPWKATVGNLDHPTQVLRSGGIFVGILFGLGLGITVHIALHPNATVLQSLYKAHINFAIFALREFQAILSLQLPVIQPFVNRTISIYKNNAILALKAGGLGLVGGLAGGLAIPLLLIMAVNAALIWGVFTGLLIRNTIATGGNVLIAPLVAYLSSLGLLLIGHTFHEFMAIVVVGLGGGFVGFAIVDTRYELGTGLQIVVLGFAQLLFAAFTEVWTDPAFIFWVKGFITIEPTIVPLSGGFIVGSPVASVSTVVVTLATAYAVVWMTNTTVGVMEDQLQ